MRFKNSKTIAICISLLIWLSAATMEAYAQYRGSPVKRDRLVQVLRSKQFQTREIIQIIKEHGVDFRLTPATQNELVSAGARPPVLDAIRSNYRSDIRVATKGQSGPATNDYASLIDQAVEAYDLRKDRSSANTFLQRAVSMQPNNPRAYQLLGFLNLYGNKNFDEAERYWKRAISLGGSAALRVIHDHSGVFVTSCKGSLYIARDTVRFESDDNKHTFETSDRNIKEIDVTNKFKRFLQFRSGSFRIILRDQAEENKFVFAPLTGKTDESKMIIRLIGKG